MNKAVGRKLLIASLRERMTAGIGSSGLAVVQLSTVSAVCSSRMTVG
jgi:hypothetical protein